MDQRAQPPATDQLKHQALNSETKPEPGWKVNLIRDWRSLRPDRVCYVIANCRGYRSTSFDYPLYDLCPRLESDRLIVSLI